MTTVTVEWGCKLDCSIEGCDPPHASDGVVYMENGVPDRSVPARLDHHAATWVCRTVTVSEWEEPE